MPKVLITGGLGYIGIHTAILFIQAGYNVIIVDNLSNSYLENLDKIKKITGKQADFYDIDIRSYENINKVLKENNDIEGIIHFAAKKAVGESCQEPFLYYQNNILGSLNLFKAMNVNKIKNIVFSGSCVVYDTLNSIPPYSENDKLNPQNPYGTTKLVIEKILKDMSINKKFNSIILRYFNPIGAHHSGLIGENPKGIPNNLVPYIYKVANGEINKLEIFGDDYNTKDGTGIRDYIHVMDLADAHLLAYQYIKEFNNYEEEGNKQEKGLYDIFNIGIGEGQSVKEILKLVEKVTDIKIPYKITKRRPGDTDIVIANPQKAKQVLGWTPKRSVYQALEDGRKYVKKNT